MHLCSCPCRAISLSHASPLCLPACRDAAAQQADGTASSGVATAAAGQQGRDASVAVHPGLVDTFLARNYFKAGWGALLLVDLRIHFAHCRKLALM